MADHINTKPLNSVLNELKAEAQDFATTRVAMLKAELNEKWTAWKAALPMIAIGAALLGAAFMIFTFGLVALAATLIGGEYAWALGAGAVFLLYGVVGGIMAWMGSKQISAEGLAPERTLRVLKQDQTWIKNEARTA
ncbi:MAG TPA: phage holin family protein [Terriglobales bacterium]|nr:phage holin family protein [Terriglobales bacterium]